MWQNRAAGNCTYRECLTYWGPWVYSYAHTMLIQWIYIVAFQIKLKTIKGYKQRNGQVNALKAVGYLRILKKSEIQNSKPLRLLRQVNTRYLCSYISTYAWVNGAASYRKYLLLYYGVATIEKKIQKHFNCGAIKLMYSPETHKAHGNFVATNLCVRNL